ncbi:unnamed protein product [Prorocentrum cordatum]|uniref:t-SNARE coiled-coil homology domain-containing protein n=1 Tax=Prorocentrum cordatum TaxID=2364126 RepID=A0ABN9R3X6_9DINO|nr:unnamed protein product [Polarella glacialis]
MSPRSVPASMSSWQEERLRTQIVQEAALRSRIAQEREEGIRRIQGQVREVNHIFRDLASMVTDQGMQFETIEQQASSASMSTREAGEELKRAAERQKNARERLCWMVAGVALLLFLLVLPSLPRSLLTSSSPQEDVAVKATGMPRAPVVPERYKSVSVPGLADGQLGLLPEGSVVVHDTARLAR